MYYLVTKAETVLSDCICIAPWLDTVAGILRRVIPIVHLNYMVR